MKIKEIEKRCGISFLNDIRQRLGADENDDSQDEEIETKSEEELVELYSGWNLGDNAWGEDFVEQFKNLKGIK
jgi:hypothetical protein